jgi:hypothetical protein
MLIKTNRKSNHLFSNTLFFIGLCFFTEFSLASNTQIAKTENFISFVKSTNWCRQQVDLLVSTDAETQFKNKDEIKKLVGLSLRKLKSQCSLMKAMRLTGFVNNKALMRGEASAYGKWDVHTYGLRGSTWDVAQSKQKQQPAPRGAVPEKATNPVESCNLKDFNCAITTRCQGYLNTVATEVEKQARYNQCLEQQTRHISKKRQQTYAAEFFVDDQQVRLFFGKHVGADKNYGDWCGETLWGKLQYPMRYNVLPSVTKTVLDIIDSSLSEHCPAAKNVSIAFYKYSPKMGIGQTYNHGEFLQAYKEDNHWHANLHPSYIQTLQAKANMNALWSMISSPDATGYATGMARYNEGANRSLLSRYARYAQEGKVCKMPTDIRHCYVSTTWTPMYGGSIGKTAIINYSSTDWSSCPSPCDDFDGYCNMKTGTKYKTVELAERSNCRVATEDEIELAIRRAQIDSSVESYPYKLHYSPYDQLPANYR